MLHRRAKVYSLKRKIEKTVLFLIPKKTFQVGITSELFQLEALNLFMYAALTDQQQFCLVGNISRSSLLVSMSWLADITQVLSTF